MFLLDEALELRTFEFSDRRAVQELLNCLRRPAIASCSPAA
jgi:hypothetical protein